jgi:cation diffusion facilitator CzcD-associated flavoprotein CzcO
VLVSNKYYPTFNRDNVELLTDPIKEITAKGVMTQNGAIREVDTIILGTGFVVDPREYLSQFQITGLKGQALLDRWREGAEAYLGITVPGFPNLFQMTGPNTSLGHNSIVFMIECQVRYIMDCLHRLKEKQAKYLDVRETVHTKYNSMIQKNLKNTVWNSGCTSWYQQADGKNFTIWPGFTFLYQQKTMKCNPDDYWWERSQQPAISIESTPQES